VEFFLDLHALSRRSSKDRFLLVGVFIDLLEAGPQRPLRIQTLVPQQAVANSFCALHQEKVESGPIADA